MESVVSHQDRDQEKVRDTRIVGQPQEGEGQEEHHHHTKKSTKILKKVKEKAKKIKDTLTKHGDGHNHDGDDGHGDHVPDDHDLDEEEDEDEEMEEDPEVHGAPIYESTVGSGDVTGQPESLSHPVKGISMAPVYDPVGFRESPDTDPTKTFVRNREEVSGQPKVNLERPRGLDEDPAAPKERPDAHNIPSNYQSKVTDPTGEGNIAFLQHSYTHTHSHTLTGVLTVHLHVTGEEAEMEPILRSFDNMKVYGEPEHEPKIKPEPEEKFLKRTDDVLSKFPTGSHDQFSPEPTPPKLVDVSSGNHPESDPETFDLTKSRDDPYENTSKQGRYLEKISFATSAIADKAASAKNAVASILGYGEKDGAETGHREIHERRDTTKPTNVSAENPQSDPQALDMVKSRDDPHSKQVSYSGKISSATSAIADKAISAKNAIASKLGYGEKDSRETDDQYTAKTASASDYGKKIATTVTEKLSPVCKRVAGAGSGVMSKLQGSGEPEAKGEEKGVSMREYVAEKLKPREEDKALSEVISGALHKRKEGSDQKVDDDNKPKGKVTESKEVADRLGSGDGDEKRVVDKFKGSLSSLFGKSEECQDQRSQQSVSSASYGDHEGFPRFGTGEVEHTVTNERIVEE